MKQVINIFLFAVLCLLGISCEKDEQRVVLSTEPSAIDLQASVSSLLLEKENLDDTVIVFSWEPADFGFDAAFSNVLQFDLEGGGFEAPREIQLDAGPLAKSFTKIDINSVFLSMNLEPGEESKVNVRLKSQIAGSSVAPVYSNPISLIVNPFSLVSYLYVPGAYQGWDIETADSLISERGNGIYEGVIDFPSADALEFKLAPAKSWTVSYGDGGGGKINTTGGGNFMAPGVGGYQITVDMNALEIEMVPIQLDIISDAPIEALIH